MATENPSKQLCFSPRTLDLKEFEALAAGAKDAGFTHVFISDLLDRTDCQGANEDSPWCEWSIVLASIFKHYLPPGMEDAYPAEFVRRQMDFMKAKHRIVEKLGLKAAYYGVEPNWIHDRVYRKHPHWRGSRADNSLRTTGLYFAPNTDHPEVRQLYRTAVREITEQCPLIEIYAFVTNDSGAFYPWEKRLYANVNGPTGYERRDMGERVVDFLVALRQGAADAGVDAFVSTDMYGRFVDDEVHCIIKALKPGVGVTGRIPGPLNAECTIGHCGSWGGSPWMPAPVINKMPGGMSVVGGAANIRTSTTRRFMTGGNSMDYFIALKAAMAMPPAGHEREKLAVLTRIAEAVFAADVADDVVDAWYTQEKAQSLMEANGVDALAGPVSLRWITRPLVAHQELLGEEERSYWEPYIYQSKAAQSDTYLDYLNLSGYRRVHNWEESSRVCCVIDSIEGLLAAAAGKLEGAAGRTSNAEAARKLRLDSYRLRALRSVTLTVRHFMQMGTLIYLRDAQNAAHPTTATTGDDLPPMAQGDMGSHGLWYMYRALRWELDNTNELIELIQKAGDEPLFFTVPKANEGRLLLGPDLLDHLRRKVNIMLDHWRDAEVGYFRPTKGG